MIFSIGELFDFVIMTVFVGFIFSDVFARPRMMYGDFSNYYSKSINWGILYSCPRLTMWGYPGALKTRMNANDSKILSLT